MDHLDFKAGGRVARLWRGNCLDVVGRFPSGAMVDHTIMDPPYEDHMHDAKRGRKTRGGAKRIRTDGHANPPSVDFESITAIRVPVAALMKASTRKWLIAFATPEGIAPWRDAIELAGAKYKRALFWCKPDSAPQFNGQCPAMAVEAMTAAWCGTGHSKWNGGGKRNWYIGPCQPPDRTGKHPTEKPLWLMRQLLEDFTQPGDVVLDPFMGSGTTGLACLQTGRSFIGIERSQGYYELACERIAAFVNQGDFFRDPVDKWVTDQMEFG